VLRGGACKGGESEHVGVEERTGAPQGSMEGNVSTGVWRRGQVLRGGACKGGEREHVGVEERTGGWHCTALLAD